MDPNYLGAHVRLRRVASLAEWRAIDARLAAYSGTVRVFGSREQVGEDVYKIGAYRIDDARGLFNRITAGNDRYPLSRTPDCYDETLFVFQYAREAHLFHLRNLGYVIGRR